MWGYWRAEGSYLVWRIKKLSWSVCAAITKHLSELVPAPHAGVFLEVAAARQGAEQVGLWKGDLSSHVHASVPPAKRESL